MKKVIFRLILSCIVSMMVLNTGVFAENTESNVNVTNTSEEAAPAEAAPAEAAPAEAAPTEAAPAEAAPTEAAPAEAAPAEAAPAEAAPAEAAPAEAAPAEAAPAEAAPAEAAPAEAAPAEAAPAEAAPAEAAPAATTVAQPTVNDFSPGDGDAIDDSYYRDAMLDGNLYLGVYKKGPNDTEYIEYIETNAETPVLNVQDGNIVAKPEKIAIGAFLDVTKIREQIVQASADILGPYGFDTPRHHSLIRLSNTVSTFKAEFKLPLINNEQHLDISEANIVLKKYGESADGKVTPEAYTGMWSAEPPVKNGDSFVVTFKINGSLYPTYKSLRDTVIAEPNLFLELTNIKVKNNVKYNTNYTIEGNLNGEFSSTASVLFIDQDLSFDWGVKQQIGNGDLVKSNGVAATFILKEEVKPTPPSKPSTPTPTVKPVVKVTCEDEGKVWNEEKQMCVVNVTTVKTSAYKVPNTATSANIFWYVVLGSLSLIGLVVIKRLNKR